MSTMFPDGRAERGFAMPIALFVIILGVVLAGSITLLSGTQQTGLAQDVLGGRAYQAARAGAEWGVHHVLRVGDATCADINNAGTGRSFVPGALAGFVVTVHCTETAHTEAGAAQSMYVIRATACNLPAGPCAVAAPGSATYVERQLRVSVGSD